MRNIHPSLFLTALLVVLSTLTSPAVAQSGASSTAAAARVFQVAQATVDQLKEVALHALASDPAWTAANKAAAQANDRLEAAKARTLATAHQSPAYTDLDASLKTATTETQKADLRASMTALDAAAIMESTEVKDARAAKTEASATVSRLWNDYETNVLSHDPKWVSAVAARDQARANLAAANAADAAARAAAAGSRSSSSAGRTTPSRSSSSSSRNR